MSIESELIAIVGTIAGCIVPAIWALSNRIGKHEARIGTGLATLSGKIEKLDTDLSYVKEELRVAREARSNIWESVNNLRDRTTRLSTVMHFKEPNDG